ncbi:AAA family ATPase [Photobacterium leiognathi]|uniref:AAA family ATPase n=1 Tax=Photobacterium leiognathi TaxID=553611 RepID=UPI002980D532|nr:P-loop NTPase [Photobacterium leiognathi]
MFNLSKTITQKVTTTTEQQGPSGCSVFYQTQECLELVNEVFRFEGWKEPECSKFSLQNEKTDAAQLQEIIILELNQSKSVIEDAKNFANRIPNHKGVIVIGQEDAITTLRGLKEMGFYYVFWPVNKQEFTDFLRHVHKNQQQFAGVSQNRKAKRVAVIGTKGGVGNSLITTELSSYLADSGAQTIMVDRQYHNSNIDILLGLKKYQKHDANNLEYQLHDMDEASANDYLTKVTDKLKVLSLEGTEPVEKLVSYTNNIADLLIRHANFIIDDYSASVDFSLDLESIAAKNNIIVLIIEPTISSIRTAQSYLQYIENLRSSVHNDRRILLFLNIHRPAGAFSLAQHEIETYLDRKVDVVLPYNKMLATELLEGKRIYKQEDSTSGAITNLALKIKGKTQKVKQTPLTKIKALFNR